MSRRLGANTSADDDDSIRFHPVDLTRPSAKDWVIRFAFGAGVSAIAALVGTFAGPQIGGLFLAFPAILLASLTLVAKDEGPKQARNDARGGSRPGTWCTDGPGLTGP